MTARQAAMMIWRGVCLALVAMLSACGAPPYQRGPHVPAEATLADWGKLGWLWELCLDAPEGSAFFTWGAEGGGGPFIRLRPARCADAGRDPRNLLRVEGSEQSVVFLFPEAPDVTGFEASHRCPHTVSREALSAFKSTLTAAIASGKLTPDAADAAAGMVQQLDSVKLDRLGLGGGVGNADAWSVRCAERRE